VRKIFLLYSLSLLLSAPNNVYCQEPYKLVDVTNKWYEYGQLGGWGYYPIQLDHLIYFFDGDTIINSIPYKKLMHDRRDTIYSTPLSIQDSYGYTAAFRQDSLDIYFIEADSINEKLYCSFNLSTGDTLNYYYNHDTLTVSSIDSIQYGSGFRKKYILSSGSVFYEGIGNSLGLFHGFEIGIEGGVYLVCFQQNGISQYVWAFGGTPDCTFEPCGNSSAYFYLYPAPDDTIPLLHYLALNLSTGETPIEYFWDWGDGTIDTIPFPSHTYDATGTYTICLSITDSTGCSDTYCNNYTFKTESPIAYINVIPHITTGIDNLFTENKILLVYPNPATNYITINVEYRMKNYECRIMNVMGQEVFHSTLDIHNSTLDISSLSPGIYFLTLSYAEQTVSSKFVKE